MGAGIGGQRAVTSAAATILVADDQAGQRAVLDMLLTLDGHRVDAVEDGRAALDYLRAHTPAMAILDIDLPFVGGIDICGRIRRISRLKGMPVIILTAASDPKVISMAKLAGPDRIVHKPLQGKDFRATVRELLADRSGAA